MKIALTSIMFICCALVLGQQGQRVTYVTAFYGQNQLILGSTDVRRGGGLAVSRVEPFRLLRVGDYVPELVYEGNIATSSSRGANGEAPNNNVELGALAIVRLKFVVADQILGFGELGWGLLYTDRRNTDLDYPINSTPMLGAGLLLGPSENHILTLRIVHISNGGLTKRNYGQNRLYLGVGTRF